MASIPKRLFFIWLGARPPVYANWSIAAFRELNPDFEICYVHRTIAQIEQIYNSSQLANQIDRLLKRSIEAILDDDQLYHGHLYRVLVDGQKAYYGHDMRFIQILADVFRLELLNDGGGIYVDLDAFPAKPFSAELLDSGSFIALRHHRVLERTTLLRDNYFIGSNGQLPVTSNADPHVRGILATDDGWWKSIQFMARKRAFFRNELKPSDIPQKFWIEHYADGNWLPKAGGIRTPRCFLDELYAQKKRERKARGKEA